MCDVNNIKCETGGNSSYKVFNKADNPQCENTTLLKNCLVEMDSSMQYPQYANNYPRPEKKKMMKYTQLS